MRNGIDGPVATTPLVYPPEAAVVVVLSVVFVVLLAAFANTASTTMIHIIFPKDFMFYRTEQGLRALKQDLSSTY